MFLQEFQPTPQTKTYKEKDSYYE